MKRGEAATGTLSISPQVAALKQLRADLAAAPWAVVALGDPKISSINPKTDLRGLDDETTVSFVPMEAVHENTNSFRATDRPLGEVRKGYTVFADGDVIWAKITPCMQNGKSALVRGLTNGIGCGSTEFHVVRAGESLLPEFLWAVLSMPRLLYAAQAAFTGSSGHQWVPASFLSELRVPVPPLDVQQKVVAELYSEKSSYDDDHVEAERMLNTADRCVLDVLGINPQGEDRKVFAVNRENVLRRLDADYNSPRFAVLRRAIERAPVRTLRLADLTVSIHSGFAAGAKDQARGGVGSLPHLRPLNLSGFGEITLEGTKSVPRDSVTDADLVQRNEVLFNNTNSAEWVGKSAVFDLDTECVCSNHMTRIVLGDQVAPYYLAALFNALRGLGYFSALSTFFNNQAGINAATLGELRIPVPPFSVQQQIADEIEGRKRRARQMQQRAAAKWKAARRRFEDQLLGGFVP